MRSLKVIIGNFRDKYFLQLIACIVAISGLLFGYDIGIISGALIFLTKDLHLSSVGSGLVVSSILLAAFFGALLSGKLADNFGRRKLLRATALIFIVGTVVVTFSFSLTQLIIGRLILGIAIGISSFIAPLYVTEISPAKIRGREVGYYQLFAAFGLLIAYVVAYLFSASENWRLMFGTGIIPVLLFLLGMIIIPESPRWAMLKGKESLARQILIRIRGDGEVEHEIAQMKENLQAVRSEWKMLLRPWILPAVFVGVGLAVFRQITGINTIIYYTPTIFEMTGAAYLSRVFFASFIIALLSIIFTMLALKLVDKWGRRPLLLTSLGGMCISLFITAAALAFGGSYTVTLRYLIWICSLLYISCFAMGLGALTFLIISEIFPLRVRGIAVSSAIAVNWLLNSIVAFTFLPLSNLLGLAGVFWLYSGICLLGIIFVYFTMPETMGVSLEQIEINLRAGKSSRHLGDI